MAQQKRSKGGKAKSTKIKARGIVADGTIMLAADAKQLQAAMKKCLKDSGKVTFRLENLSVTKLGKVVDLANIVN